tara:strand:- start:1390 stop:2217 length:828 start_codon:yes stop_codon:yes gene_type:complete
LITGGSRGIGLAIVERLSNEGACIAILDKNEEALKAATAALENTHGEIIPIPLDITQPHAIKQAIIQLTNKIDSIDALINNVSSFCFKNTTNITAEEYDLMMATNGRGTFFMTQACLPYLKKAKNPHVINISPPLDINAKWFKKHLAFTMSKYNMSMCTLGMAEELKGSIAINSIRPQTTIATNTITKHFDTDVYAGSRKPTIMADAIAELLKYSFKETTGNFYTDEQILKKAGIKDFKSYAVNPNIKLVQDLFLPDEYGSDSACIPLTDKLFLE